MSGRKVGSSFDTVYYSTLNLEAFAKLSFSSLQGEQSNPESLTQKE
jgi:hypothetical protein